MSNTKTKKIALVMSAFVLMTQMGFADVANEEVSQDAQEQVLLKKDKNAVADVNADDVATDAAEDKSNEG